MYLLLLENILGQDVTNPIPNTQALKKKKKKGENVGVGKHTTGKEGTVSPSAALASGDFLFPFSSAHFITYATANFPLLPCQSQALRPPFVRWQ